MESFPLSIVILTNNEEDCIRRCLKSIAWCDDILLLDDSTDKTVAVAQKTIPKNTLRIIPVTEKKDFAYIRNFGLTKAKHEWVLFLDADEEVSEELTHEMKIVLSLRSNNTTVGYFLKRKDYFLGKWLKYGETGNIKLLKLGKKSAGKWRRQVHEVWDIEKNVSELISPLFHFPHPTISEFLIRINRWTDIDAQVFFDQGVSVTWWKIIGYPVGKFVRSYVIQRGFADGMPGLIMALMMSFHSFLTRAKLYMLQKSKS